MIAKTSSTDVSIQSIQHDTQSIATTTALTLNLLRAILGLGPEHPSHTTSQQTLQATGKNGARKQVPTAPKQKPKRPADRKPPTFEIYESPGPAVQPLQPQEMRKLATNTFNAVLRNLTAAAKTSKDEQTRNMAATPDRRIGGAPLQDCSPNRQMPPSPAKRQDSLPKLSGNTRADLTADCALSCLAALTGSAGAKSGEPDARTEELLNRGSLILIDKLVSLRLGRQAVEAIEFLKSRLTLEKQPRKGPDFITAETERGDIGTLCQISIDGDSRTVFEAATSLQSQILRLALTEGMAAITSSLVECLAPTNMAGPCGLILKGLETNHISKLKANQQLRTLAQTIINMCSDNQQQMTLQPHFNTIFELRAAALKIRAHALHLQSNTQDWVKDIWNLFARYLKKYMDTSAAHMTEAFEIAHTKYESLQILLDTVTGQSNPDYLVDDILGEMATQADLITEGLRHLRRLSAESPHRDDVSAALLACRIATLQLREKILDVPLLLSDLKQAVEALKNFPKNSMANIKDVVLHTTRLRRACSRFITRMETTVENGRQAQDSDKLLTSTMMAVYGIQNLLLSHLRSLGALKRKCTAANEEIDITRALISAAEKAYGITKGIAKLRQASSSQLWHETDSALQDALLMVEAIQKCPMLSELSCETTGLLSSCQQDVSAIYWFWFGKTQMEQDLGLDELQLASRSISALVSCSNQIQLTSQLPLKQQRFAILLARKGEFNKAKEILSSALKLLIQDGALNEAVEAALSRPSRQIWAESSLHVGMLGKALSSFVELSLQQSLKETSTAFFDDCSLPPLHRATIIAKQVLLAIKYASSSRWKEPVLNAVKEVLHLLSGDGLEVCRLQFACDLLIASSRSEAFSVTDTLSEYATLLQSTSSSSPSSRCFLSAYNPTLRLLFAALWCLQIGQIDKTWLHSALAQMESCVKSTHSSVELKHVITESSVLCHSLLSLGDYLKMLGQVNMAISAVKVSRHVLELEQGQEPLLCKCLLKLADFEYSKGSANEGERTLAAVKLLLGEANDNPSLSMQYHITRARNLMFLGNLEDSLTMLQAAGRIFDSAFRSEDDLKSRSRTERDFLLSRANSVSTQIALRTKDIASAFIFARRSMKLMSGLWASLEKHCPEEHQRSDSSMVQQELSAVADGISELSLTGNSKGSKNTSRGAVFWPYVEIYLSSLLENSMLCSNAGLAQDAVFFAEQASKVAQKIGCSHFALKSMISAAILKHRASLADNADTTYGTLMGQLSELDTDVEKAGLCIDVIELALLSDKNAYIQTYTELAESVMRELHQQHVEPKIVTQTQAAVPGRAIVQKGSRKPGKRVPAVKIVKHGLTGFQDPDDPSRTTHSSSSAPLATLRGRHDVLFSLTERLKSLQLAAASRSETGRDPTTKELDSQAPDVLLVSASQQIAFVIKQLSSDSVHCILDEIPLCLPSSYIAPIKQEQKPVAPRSKGSKKITATAKTPSPVKDVEVEAKTTSATNRILKTTYHVLGEKLGHMLSSLPSYSLHQRHQLLSTVTLLDSALDKYANCLPVELTWCSINPKNAIRERERLVLNAENATLRLPQMLTWPSHDIVNSAKIEQRQDETSINNLPNLWTLLSLSLNEDATELIVTRQTRNRQPFVLRLPLSRSSTDELDSTEFTFQDAKAELLKIVQRANATAHDARSQGEKGARRDWWTARESLDARLEVLLTNIDNLWLGGFRGILSNEEVDENLLPRFAQALDRSLGQHLPSRQKQNKSLKGRVQLHTYVLELFLKIGCPDDLDLNDALTELLYFVVEILQLHGEQNAYDEIDFDMMLMEITDALRAYHNGRKSQSDRSRRHTILVLDKELHCFPWESLPCLTGHSISRMPCTQELTTRITQIVAQDSEASYLKVAQRTGTYVLNPSGDLTSTQQIFQSCFESQLASFNSLINRVPSETELSSFLHDDDIFLYFGHGSGAQYIRPRTIKKLNKCAVTFLMGCSSSKLTEYGQFEPSGVPWNYMMAGASAVIGTLWDVTDKDIDRFAMRAFLNWGLLAESPETKIHSSKGKGKAKESVEKRTAGIQGKMTLDEAVSDARDACVLRFLNGAAPVIYGIPVGLS